MLPWRIRPTGMRRLPGFEEVPVTLRGASRIAFFKLISSVGGQGGPKDYVTEVSSSLNNFHIMDNFILLQCEFPNQTSPSSGICDF